MKRLVMGLLTMAAFGALACGGNPCEKLVKFYCEEKQDQNLCQMYTERVNAGMSKENCEANLKQAK